MSTRPPSHPPTRPALPTKQPTPEKHNVPNKTTNNPPIQAKSQAA